MSVLDGRDASARGYLTRGYLSSSVNVEKAAELRSIAIDAMHSAMTIFRVRDLGAAVEWRALVAASDATDRLPDLLVGHHIEESKAEDLLRMSVEQLAPILL